MPKGKRDPSKAWGAMPPCGFGYGLSPPLRMTRVFDARLVSGFDGRTEWGTRSRCGHSLRIAPAGFGARLCLLLRMTHTSYPCGENGVFSLLFKNKTPLTLGRGSGHTQKGVQTLGAATRALSVLRRAHASGRSRGRC